MQKALITGASGGIGRELALLMAAKGHDLILVSRNIQNLEKVKKEIQSFADVNVEILVTDLSKVGSAKDLYNKTKNKNIEILINNAGVGQRGDFFHDDFEKTTQLAELNMISLMQLCQLFGKDFIAKNKGKILNVGSIVAFIPGPKQAVYYATKSFVRSLGRALAYNLRNTNVTVTTLHPGVTKTGFFQVAGAKNFSGGAPALAVAHLAYKAMMQGRTEVTHGLWNKLLTNVFVRFVPYRLQTYIVDRVAEV